MRTSAVMSIAWTSKSPRATTDPKGLAKRPKLDSTCLPGSKTTTDCDAFSTPRKSPQGSLPYENPTHSYGCAPLFRLYRRGSSVPLPCGDAFRLLHLPAVFAVHQG